MTESFSHIVNAASASFRAATAPSSPSSPPRVRVANPATEDSLLSRLAARTGTSSSSSSSSYTTAGPPAPTPYAKVTLFATPYPSLSAPDFAAHFASRIWLTYRHSYAPIRPSSYTSDVGWGCMLRSGQMLLANAFLLDALGKDWRLVPDKYTFPIYRRILLWFLDCNAAPYSIHRIALLGNHFDKKVGEWFGPSTISQVLKVLVQNHKEANLALHVASDGMLYKDDVKAACLDPDAAAGSPEAWKPVLILVPLRLGVESLNPVYHPGLKACFDIPHCVGIAGGRPNSSLFFMGVEGNNLIYLDPHFLRPAVEVKDPASYSLEDLASFHCDTVRTTAISNVDPSLVIGFYCKDRADFEEFCNVAQSISLGKTPLFSIEQKMPSFDEMDHEVDFLSEGDEF
ncbi:hypothetical protein BDK51DRAFT_24259 [Blyttiomyces helicus]|uniref:Cysteine protease n=1 Tax=Blyttiomyces helicus TaxID=388810 RepID=A0A4P9WA33_9FUNG|nr:hypothetical protein BDK51DRAFT_24259 [Blyttiomyces helicus]|eukprot:RKO89062.1 hypothetical protein BDK51DRAFT_24259 [Blyttiomyces helicus]